jgi:hypothetical protein
MSSPGSAYSQFKRALERRNFVLAWALAAELPKVPLADALSLLLLALDQQPWRFETAAPRWQARSRRMAALTRMVAPHGCSNRHSLHHAQLFEDGFVQQPTEALTCRSNL